MERIIQKINLILGITAHLQNRGFSARLRDSGFVLYLGSQMHFGEKSPASQMREPLAERQFFPINRNSQSIIFVIEHYKQYLTDFVTL
jgi:hypothetical protein